MTAQKSAIFNDYQQQALAMLGVPLWQVVAADQAAASQSLCYRFEQWLVLSDSRLESANDSWQSDLIAVMADLTEQSKSALVEVSTSTALNWPAEKILDLRSTPADVSQLAHLKLALWQQVSHALRA